MERVRLEGLDSDLIRLNFARDAFEVRREPLSPSGVSKDFQQAFAELRTDLDAFTTDEANGLMACGYQMASKALDEQLPKLRDVWKKKADGNWGFKRTLDDMGGWQPCGRVIRLTSSVARRTGGSKILARMEKS
jgi:hypothetical protein